MRLLQVARDAFSSRLRQVKVAGTAEAVTKAVQTPLQCSTCTLSLPGKTDNRSPLVWGCFFRTFWFEKPLNARPKS